ncbi:hypothetical protein FEM48_Zijuj08G0153700 [Ziziphus jujuba var. spinosa]|uniref:Glycosyltransferase n=1 Tax=Ziziphus jujuba var. spinosa TaxID=714518 RepID=A0A978UZW4_ZIZJJ|nr:hypothetical protein FEM48_Zijuj08G0153700 [Ziziphus jujuba var. spinosa]
MLVTKPQFDPKFGDYVESLVAASPVSERINFVALQSDHAFTETNHNVMFSLFMEHQKPQVKNAVSKLIQSSEADKDDDDDSPPRLAGFVIDQLCSCMIDVANEFRVPSYVFFTVSAGFTGLMFHLQALRYEENINPAELNNDPDAKLVLPSFVNPVPVWTFPEPVLDKAACTFFLNHHRRIRKAKGIIVNTFLELEPKTIKFLSDHDQFPPVYSVGPSINLTGYNSHVASAGDGNGSDVIRWLDDQPHSSVLFLCFGNVGSFDERQVKEIGYALENSGTRFLWSLRQRPSSATDSRPNGEYTESMEVFVKEFLDRTAGKGKIIKWAPQVAILSHPAVGGFVSHCGWNSILESLWFGVPIATWPLYAEQQLNAFELVKELGLAVDIKLDYAMVFNSEKDQVVVSAQEIEVKIRRLMEQDSDLRKRAKEFREKSRKAVMDGGSSYSSLGRLINDVINNTP